MNTGCYSILNRPYSYGGGAINDIIDTLSIPQNAKPNILFETTNNSVNCAIQVLDPSTGGHQLDSYWTRTVNMATHFADNIGVNTCNELNTSAFEYFTFKIYPNPATSNFTVVHSLNNSDLLITDTQGKKVLTKHKVKSNETIDISSLNRGIYFVQLVNSQNSKQVKLVVVD